MIRGTIVAPIAAVALGILLGGGSLWAITGPLAPEDLQVGEWDTLMDIGEAEQSPYTRARVAIYGIWGLPPDEVLYFTGVRDAAGDKLDGSCQYEVKGGPAPARWWSLTAYRDGFYIDNPADRYSWSSSTVTTNADGRWTVRLSPNGAGVNGLALGAGDGAVALSYRLYQPTAGLADNRRKVPLPTITKISCTADSVS